MSKDFTASQLGPVDIPSAEQRKAQLYVAAEATDKADCTRLLAMLGLLPSSHPDAHPPAEHGLLGYRRGCRCKRCRAANAGRRARQRTSRKGAVA
ncbi:hypothetical protein [Streptomyces sp. NRRL S-1022]|uniref:hypothetical protein n=1 Tax=Streptomyces sp. NRRL S-1022 TaxID=1463880 RepID=UPI0004C210B4|nr:hypothetical protein [Streptomyces sp. NRRL S-1022]